MARHSKMSLAMQTAAVKSAFSEGKSLDEIEKDYPELSDGIKAVRSQMASTAPPPSRRGSGSISARSSMTRRPTL